MGENKYLSLSDLLDSDVTSFEYFNGLPSNVRQKLEQFDDVTTFRELQHYANRYLHDSMF